MSDISLSLGIKTSLLSLQKTEKLFTETQERMTSGKKVNKPTDDPASFYAASTLTNRAESLEGRLDGMGQAVQSINAADNGIQAMKSILSSMSAVVENALSTTDTSERQAMGKQFNKLLVQLEGFANDSAYGGVNLLKDEQVLEVQLGQKYDESVFEVEGFHIEGVDTVNEDDEVDPISSANLPNTWTQDPDGSVTQQLSYYPMDPISVSEYQAYAFDDVSNTLNYTDSMGNKIELNHVESVEELNGNLNYVLQYDPALQEPATALDTNGAFPVAAADVSSDGYHLAGTTLTVLDEDGTASVVSANASNVSFEEGVLQFIDNSQTPAELTKLSSGLDFFSHKVNNAGADVAYLDDAGVAQTITYAAVGTEEPVDYRFNGDGELEVTTQAAQSDEDAGIAAHDEDFVYDATRYAFVINKVENPNEIVGIKSYGTDDTGPLGHEVNWGNEDSFAQDLGEVQKQIEAVDEVLTTRSKLLSFDQSTVSLREDYTKEFVNALESGADQLTLADLNEEAANLLALQTSQQLGTQSLSLTNEQTQNVLRLLG